MSNTTTDYWDIGGVSLDTHAWGRNVWETGQAPPEPRGTDLVVPNRPGAVLRPRVADSRTITLPMWVTGQVDADGVVSATPKTLFESQWTVLRAVMYAGGQPVNITKRWGGGANSATAVGVFVGGLELSNLGDRQAARFTCDYRLADPWFYSSPNDSDVFTNGSTAPAWTGTAPTHHYNLRFVATTSWEDPTFEVKKGTTTLSSVTYEGTITASKWVEVSMPTMAFSTDDAGATVAGFTHTEHQWVAVDPLATSVVLSQTSGSGYVELSYTPAYV